jgi:putative addiction module killer protein
LLHQHSPYGLRLGKPKAQAGCSGVQKYIAESRLVSYKTQMVEIRQTKTFLAWLQNLSDREASRRIADRILRLHGGLYGDAAPVGEGVSELRIHFGPGYRVYFVQRGKILIILLCGGNKKTQSKDIAAAKAMARDLKE